MAQILVVDDDAILREGLADLLAEEGYGVVQASSGTEALEMLPELEVQCILMDVQMPGLDGLQVLKAMRQDPACPPVVVMTAYGTTATAIDAMKLGAFDYVLKPFDIPALLAVAGRAAEAGARQKEAPKQAPLRAGPDGQTLVGSSLPMQEIYKAIGRVAPTDALVLVRGESGTGKELVARSIWKNSARADGPFAVVNCVAIPDTLLESELFGYEKGSFTGAQQAKPGRIEQAAGGTVFLDEIGDMPLNVQAKFLRLLQERQIERIGAPNPVPVDVRIVAATNVDLERAVREGRFREDLYYRLKVVTLWLPPLRERLGDVPELASALLARQAAALGVPNPGIGADAVNCLQKLEWPGNVRELANLLQTALVFSDGSPLCREDILRAREGERAGRHDGSRAGRHPFPDLPVAGGVAPMAGSLAPGVRPASLERRDRLDRQDLPAGVLAEAQEDSLAPQTLPPAQEQFAEGLADGSGSDLRRARKALEAMADAVLASHAGSAFDVCMDAMGRAVVKRALELCQGNRSQAARLLGLSRPTLLAHMKRYGLKVETRIS
ncbi:MAG: sigma-54-dependent Fis family transcriptional regulator [Desulfovibrio sp.]|nr:sigma-54-dependent Fis family transcriptional regulator [Desulfovibrio sp.]